MKTTFLLFLIFIFICTTGYAQNKPFPQNVNYPYGFKPASITSDYVKSDYQTLKQRFVVKCNDTYRVKYEDATQTRGEAIGFVMILAAYMGDRELFDGLYEFYKMKTTSQAKGMMAWNVTCEGIVDPGSATDIDIDVAFALVVAYDQWEGIYLEEAEKIIKILETYMITECNGVKILYPGYSGAPWGGCHETDIQYYTPGFFRIFAKISGNKIWDQLADDSYILLNNSADEITGLVPDWQKANGEPTASRERNYRYDACRVPWRMSLDYLWNGNSKALTWCKKISDWAYDIGPANIKDTYKLDGTPAGNNHNSAFVGGFAVSAMCNNQDMVNDFGAELKKINDNYWFNNCTRTLYLFTLSGNFWKPSKYDPSSSTGEVKKNEINIFPNPSKEGRFHIDFNMKQKSSEDCKVEVYDSAGEAVYSKIIDRNQNSCSVDLGTRRGVFIINISGKDIEYSTKLIVE